MVFARCLATGKELVMRCTLALCAALLAAPAVVAAPADSLKKGTPEVKSITALAFGPDGILFIGDSAGGQVVAVDTADAKAAGTATVGVEKLDEKLAALLGSESKEVRVADMKVNPASGNVYLAVARGTTPLVVKLDRAGKMSELAMKDIPFASVKLPNAGKEDRRGGSITGLAFVDGKVIVAGLSHEEFASKLRVIPFPFKEADPGTSVEIYHGAHGKFETNSPVRTFTPYVIDGEPSLLAAYTCTPLVKFPLKDLKPGQKIQGTTVAELGNQNQPLDMVTYKKDGKDFLLIANSKRGVMKAATADLGKVEAIKEPVKGGKSAGLAYETVADLKGVMQLDKLDDARALVLVKKEDGSLNLQTIPLP